MNLKTPPSPDLPIGRYARSSKFPFWDRAELFLARRPGHMIPIDRGQGGGAGAKNPIPNRLRVGEKQLGRDLSGFRTLLIHPPLFLARARIGTDG
jgi:hypothetical protein